MSSKPFTQQIRPPSFGSPLLAESVAADRVDPAWLPTDGDRASFGRPRESMKKPFIEDEKFAEMWSSPFTLTLTTNGKP